MYNVCILWGWLNWVTALHGQLTFISRGWNLKSTLQTPLDSSEVKVTCIMHPALHWHLLALLEINISRGKHNWAPQLDFLCIHTARTLHYSCSSASRFNDLYHFGVHVNVQPDWSRLLANQSKEQSRREEEKRSGRASCASKQPCRSREGTRS